MQIPTHCGQPESHNINAKLIEQNKIDINCISVYSGPVCPGVKYPEIYSIIIPKKYLTRKKIDLEIKQEEVIEHPTDRFEILNGNWIEGEYNDSLKIVEPSTHRGKKQTLSFSNGQVQMTERGGCTPVKVWRGKYLIEKDILSIEYLDFITTEGIEKETIKNESYKIMKLTENELLLYDATTLGLILIKGYLRNQK